MKKTIIAILVTVCVMTIIFGCVILYINNQYEVQLTEAKNTYDTTVNELVDENNGLIDENNELENEYNKLSEDMDNLELEVYRVLEGSDEYEIELDINGSTHRYTSKRDGWFVDKSHSITTIY